MLKNNLFNSQLNLTYNKGEKCSIKIWPRVNAMRAHFHVLAIFQEIVLKEVDLRSSLFLSNQSHATTLEERPQETASLLRINYSTIVKPETNHQTE